MLKSKKILSFLMILSLVALLCSSIVFATGEETAIPQSTGFKDFVIENLDAEGLESDVDFAQAYIDNYDVALQYDTNRAENYEAAVALVRENSTPFFATIWSLLPPVIAILLALITKEVYSSLFVGIVAGALLNANFNVESAYNTIIGDGFISVLADSWNVGILIFLVVLGMFTALMNKENLPMSF